MADLVRFRDAVSELERIQKSLAALPKSGAADWRLKVIEHRKQLQEQIGAMTKLAAWSDFKGSDEERAGLRDALSRMRSALALHQANWPAVSIDPLDPAYQVSTAHVRQANRAFIDMAKAMLANTPSSREQP